MIQRIQTLYLSLVVIFSALLINVPFLNITTVSSVHEFRFSGIYPITGSEVDTVVNSYPMALIIVLIPLITLITIFLFRNRKLQIILTILTMILILVSVLLGIYYAISFTNSIAGEIFPNIKVAFPLISLILLYMAYRGIRHDENLVKSYDRLR